MPHDSRTKLYFEIHGSGSPLFLGPHFATCDAPWLREYLDRLTDRYRVLVIDPPGHGKSAPLPAAEFTADRLCEDFLSVADAAGFDRFTWCGYSWGSVVGLQLAQRSDRLDALVCGGWPPLGGEYEKLLGACRSLVAEPPSEGPYAGYDAAPFVTLYESLRGWPEAESVRRITCPRMTFFGSDDATVIGDVTMRIAATLRERREELERSGWRVIEVPGWDHALFTAPGLVVPAIRKFLDAVVTVN